jgi:hypothetical protein
MSISMRFALGERTMLETPILIVIIVLVIAAVVWLSLMGRWSCCDAQSLTGSIL